MRRLLLLALGTLLLAGPAPANATGPVNAIGVATRNEYLGADLTPIILAQTPQEFVEAATAALGQIAANDFPLRAKALARELRKTRPDVIGLQEAYAFTVNGATLGPPFVDMLEETLRALAAAGLHYQLAGTVENLDVTLPLDATGDGVPDAVRVLDRDVILVREGIPFAPVAGDYEAGGLCGVPVPNPAPVPPFPATLASVESEDGCNFTVVAGVSSPLGPITIERGFLGVDVTVGGRDFRVVNTHLEVRQPDPANPASAVFQFLQSVELAATLRATTPADRTLVVLGDFNSSPADAPVGPLVPPYQVMRAAGFADTWLANPLRILDPDGFTCCQDADLANESSALYERIDLIWVDEGQALLPLEFLTGRLPLRPVQGPARWASDHAGVFGRLLFRGQ